MKDIKILIRNDDSKLERRFSSLETAFRKKNNSSCVLDEIRDIKNMMNKEQDKHEKCMSSKMEKLDKRLNNVFEMMSKRIDNMSRDVKKEIRVDIRNLISNDAKMDRKLDKIDNALKAALRNRPTMIYNTTISRGANVVPFPA